MNRSGIRDRRWWFGTLAAVLVVVLLATGLKPFVEQAIQSRIESAALRHGVVARMKAVRIGIWPLLRLDGLELDLGHRLRFQAGSIAITWPVPAHFTVREALLTGPAGTSLGAASTDWRLGGLFRDELTLMLRGPRPGLSLRMQKDRTGPAWNIEAKDLDVGGLFELRRGDHPLLGGGIATGRVTLQSGPETLRFGVDFGLRRARLGALAGDADDNPQLGDPTDLSLRFDGAWQRSQATLDVPDVHATVAGAALSGSLALTGLDADPAIDLALVVQRLDFAQLFGASGLELPERLGLPSRSTQDLGVASLDFRVRGPLAEPAALMVSQKIDFKPPRELPAAITRLRGDFVFSPLSGTGQDRPIDLSPEAPDFIALHDVPPLFLRTLLLAEDSAFYGHRGIDLREMPAALVTNWSRGGAARGASTITQQLAKNLFLSRDKQVGRKLQELAITFLLESALGKPRILEIYLNIIEWGPDLRGLRPAARHYFGVEPAALTPVQMAFLVSIIPGPILYQRSLADGRPGPGLRVLVDNLLAKLRSVDAISEAEYQQALADPLSLEP